MNAIIDTWAWLDKDSLSVTQLQALRAKLTVVPRRMEGFPGDDEVKPLQLYEERQGLIGVPREFYFLYTRGGTNPDIRVCDGGTWPGDLTFTGVLRPEQEKGVSTVVERLQSGKLGGLIQAVPGWGKTVAACALIARLKVPTLVVVHKEFLMDQWKKRIAEFLPNARIGIAQQDVCDYEGKHVVIAMVHSVAGRAYPYDFYRHFGLVVTDECHRIGASTWSVVPPKFPARWRVGFSATPRRKDGCEAVFKWHLGPILFRSEEKRLVPKIRRVWTEFALVKTKSFNPNLAPRPTLLRFLCGSTARNELIIEQLVKAIEADRKIIVLSERLQHLETLETMLLKTWKPAMGYTPTTGFYVGGRTKGQLETASKARVVFATSQFVAEGLDIPELDTLFLTTPLSDVEQAVGRILRPAEGKKDPIVVDFRDDRVPKFKSMGERRDRFYKQFDKA